MPIILLRWYITCICKCDVIDLHLLLWLAAALNIAPVRKTRDVIELHLFLWLVSCTKHWSCQVWKVLYFLSLPSPLFAPFGSPSSSSFSVLPLSLPGSPLLFFPLPSSFFWLVLSFLFFPFLSFSSLLSPPPSPSLVPSWPFSSPFPFSLLSLFLPFSSFCFFSVFSLPFLSFPFFSLFLPFLLCLLSLSFFSAPSLPFLLFFSPLCGPLPSPRFLFCSCPLSTLLSFSWAS